MIGYESVLLSRYLRVYACTYSGSLTFRVYIFMWR